MNKSQKEERRDIWLNLNSPLKARRIPLKPVYNAIKFHKSLNALICPNHGTVSKSYNGKDRKVILDESNKPLPVRILQTYTGNLSQEFLSQTNGLLSKVVKIEDIVKEMENLNIEEKHALAALLSTDLSFKIPDTPLEKTVIRSAQYDMDNVSVKGEISKESVLKSFNNTIDISLQSLSLGLDDRDKVSHFLSFFMNESKQYLDKYYKNCFSDLISNKCELLPQKIMTVPKKLTHFTKKKNYESIEICANKIFGTNPVRWVLSYDPRCGAQLSEVRDSLLNITKIVAIFLENDPSSQVSSFYNDRVTLLNRDCTTHCPGGFLSPFLTTLLFIATSKFESVIMYLETYNGKSSGIVYQDENGTSNIEDIFNEFTTRGRTQASMIIPEIIGILKDVLVPFKTEVFLSTGLIARGTTFNNNEMALIKFNTIELKNANITNLRHEPVFNIFKKNNLKVSDDEVNDVDDEDNDMDDEVDDEDFRYEKASKPMLGIADNTSSLIRLAHFPLLRAKRYLQLYHTAGYSLPLLQSMTANLSRKRDDDHFSISFSNSSKIIRVQTYVPALRSKESSRYESIGICEQGIFDKRSAKKWLKSFEDSSRSKVNELQDPEFKLGARCEVTSLVQQPVDGIMTSKLIRDGLFCLISDVTRIKETSSHGFCASSITNKISLGIDAIVGIGTALFEMVGTPSLVKESTRLETLEEFGASFNELKSVISSFWSGAIRMNGSSSYTPCMSILAARHLFSPYCYGVQELLKATLQNKQNSIYDNLRIKKVSVKLGELLKNDRVFHEKPMNLLHVFKDTSQRKSTTHDQSHVCMTCYQLFSQGCLKTEEILFHPCLCLSKDRQATDVIGIHSKRVFTYISKLIESLTPDQSNILSAVAAQKNVIIVAAAGCGKTHLLKLLNFIYRRVLGPTSTIVTAMFNIIATSLHGYTLHSFLRLGCAAAEAEGRFINNKESDLKEFIDLYYDDPIGLERLEHIRVARIMIIDETSGICMILFRFLDRLLRYVRRSHLPFGGMQMVLAMDPLQFTTMSSQDELNKIRAVAGCRDFDSDHHKAGFYHDSLITGKNWFYGLLNENIRSKDIRWTEFLKNARRSELTNDDLDFYKTHVGTEIPHTLKIKWLFINYLIKKKADHGSHAYVSRLGKFILEKHDELFSSIGNILEFRNNLVFGNNVATKNFNYNSSENITVLVTEHVTIKYGNIYNSLEIDKLAKLIIESGDKDIKFTEIEKDSIVAILKEINASNNDNNDDRIDSSRIPQTNVIELRAVDTYYIIVEGEKKLIHASPKEIEYFESHANKDKNQLPKTLDVIKGSIAFSLNSSELYIDNHQRLKVINRLNDTLLIEPLYDHGLIGPNRYMKTVTRETVFKCMHHGKFYKKSIMISRVGYPIKINSALMVQASMGIQLNGVLFDNSRFSNEGNAYIAAGRVPLPQRFDFTHSPGTVEEFNQKYFSCNKVSKLLDDYLNKEKARTDSNIIPINFTFDYNGKINPIQSEF